MEPKIRFKGFEGEWKASTIGDFCSVSIGEFVIKTKQNDNAPYPVYNGGSSYTGFYENYNQEGPKVIVSARGANAGVVNYCEKNFWAGNSCYSIATKDNRNLKFLYHCLKKNQSNYLNNQQAANIPSISKKDIQETILVMPKSFEQQAIASYFTSLDSQISAATSRLASLKQMKAASLQAMFPQEGETVPKIRFKGFEGEWKEQSLSGHNFFIIAGGDVDKILLQNNGKYPVIANALTNDGILGYYMDSYRVDGPAVTVTGRGDIGIAIARHYSFTPVVRLLSIKSNHNVDFLANAINCYKVAKESTGVPQLTTAKLQEYRIKMPMNIDEENAIGNYFTSLDRQISLQSQRLEKLKQIKSACLDKMFV